MEGWLSALGSELGLSQDAVQRSNGPLLDLVRDVAHEVTRPAGPLTAFLVGLSAGISARDGQDLTEVAADRIGLAAGLASRWRSEHPVAPNDAG